MVIQTKLNFLDVVFMWKVVVPCIFHSKIFKRGQEVLREANISDNFPSSEKCLYLKLFWSAFSRIRTEYEEIRSISPYSVQMRENMDQNNSEYGHFSRNGKDFDLTQPIRCQYSY